MLTECPQNKTKNNGMEIISRVPAARAATGPRRAKHMKIETIKTLGAGNVVAVYMPKGYLKKINRAFLEKDPNEDRSILGYKVFRVLNPENFCYLPDNNKVRLSLKTIVDALGILVNEDIEEMKQFKWYSSNMFKDIEKLMTYAYNYRTTGHAWDSISESEIISAEYTIALLTYKLQNNPVPIKIYGYLDIIFRCLVKIINETKNTKI